jgi:hypothetical protein
MKSEQLEIAQLKREVAKLNAERAILKEGAVDSTDERNMIDIMSSRRIHNGADGSAWFVVTGEAGAMGAVESRPIVERHWSQSGQACRIDLRRVALKGRYRTSGKSPFATVVVCARTRRDIPRISGRLIVAEDCSTARPSAVNDQPRGRSE